MNWNELLCTNRSASAIQSVDIRNSFQRDYDRIIFSSPFRRLQNKTQVFPLPGSKMVHNRLTHSLEVASVGRSIARMTAERLIKMDASLAPQLNNIDIVVSAACLAHDLGNPPFGHSGEDTISSFFKEGAGRALQNQIEPEQWSDLIAFEGNANAIRILTHQFQGRRQGGFSLTYATLASLIKYPYPSFNKGDRKKYNIFHSEIGTFQEIMQQCGIPRMDDTALVYARHPLSYMMEAADDICYLILDMEDAHKRDIFNFEEIENCFMSFFDPVADRQIFEHKKKVYEEVTDKNELLAFLRALVINKLVGYASKIFIEHYEAIMAGTFKKSLISYLPDFENNALMNCREISTRLIYKNASVVKIELTGFNVLGDLLQTFTEAILHPESTYHKKLISLIPQQFLNASDADCYTKVQSVLDFISSMTDLYAVQLYKDLRGIGS